MKQTHCVNGHEMVDDNCYFSTTDGYTRRTCKICHNERIKQRKQGVPRKTLTKDEKFFGFVSPEPMSGCWLWIGPVTNDTGYGDFVYNGERQLAHRFSYERFVGKIPEGLFACHKCDVWACVNPDHLFAGTAKDNYEDARSKNRHACGERSGPAKLTKEQVVEILRSSISANKLAPQFGVSRRTVDKIRTRENWKEVAL